MSSISWLCGLLGHEKIDNFRAKKMGDLTSTTLEQNVFNFPLDLIILLVFNHL